MLNQDPIDLLRSWLPSHLGERICGINRAPGGTGAVCYWMRAALRAHENPALDVAMEVARRLDRPFYVLQTLDADDPFASDRFHTFYLESIRDVQRELAHRQIAFALDVQRSPGSASEPSDRRSVFTKAGLVVTEEIPLARQRALAEAYARHTPFCTVDASCVVPMTLTSAAPERAFRFREDTGEARAARLKMKWVETASARSELPDDLPFEPVDLRAATDAHIAELCAACDIDHLVGPVREMPGGSRAGYARWTDYLDERLVYYGQRRNDPLRPNAVSRMSAYLHFGCVSPMRLALEANAHSADKYLDELLVWRELAWHFCYHTRDVDSLEAVPEWARRTLAEHEGNPRANVFVWEQLARARTGDALWDTAQRSLIKHGELHNNVRMTWGKALLDWTATPADALRLALDLNHRYALDGRDPASYGGILWCFGLFDRPFQPPQPVRGTLRPRATAGHAERLDVAEWARHIDRPAYPRLGRVAVIGAGIAGLTCARALQDHGLDVTVFDKGRGPGGRMASRRADGGTFDHGAQYFTTHDRHFGRYLDSWVGRGLAAMWNARFVELRPGEDTVPIDVRSARYVGTPRMSALTRHLAGDLDDLRTSTAVRSARWSGGSWRVMTEEDDEHAFDRLVVALPAPQAEVVLAEAGLPVVAEIALAELEPCWAAMLEFDAPLAAGFDGAVVHDSPIVWMARNSSKPGREGAERWVVQANGEWTRAHLERTEDEVAASLAASFAELVGRAPPVRMTAHRWRFARVSNALGHRCLFDPERSLVVCGDWCVAPRVEAAWSSGAAAAGRLLGSVDC